MKTLTTLTLLLALVGLALALLTLPSPAPAQWTNDPWNGMVPVCTAEGAQGSPRTCALGAGRFLIAWYDPREGLYNAKTYYQILDPQGVPLLEPNGRPLFIGNSSYGWSSDNADVGLIGDGEGGCIAVVIDNRDSTWDVYGQRFDSLGNRLWGETGLPLAIWPGTQMMYVRDLNADSLGGFFLSWAVPLSSSNGDMYLQKFTREGERLWGEYGAPVCVFAGDQDAQQSVPDGQGGILDVWNDNRTGSYFAYAQHLDSNGNPLLTVNGLQLTDPHTGLPIGIGADGGLAGACPDGTGGAVVAYEVLGAYWYLFRMNGAGRVLWRHSHTYQEECYVGEPLYHPINHSIWIPAAEYHYPPGAWGDYLYRFNLNGNPLFGLSGIELAGNSILCNPITTTTDGVIAATFRQQASISYLRATRVDSTGHVVWSSNINLYQDYANYDNYFALTEDGADGVICAWGDGRNASPDIYAQRVRSDGSLGSSVPHPPYAPDWPHYELSARGYIITLIIPQAGEIKLELFNLLGQKVRTVAQGYYAEGESRLELDTSALASGVYLLHLTASGEGKTVKLVVIR